MSDKRGMPGEDGSGQRMLLAFVLSFLVIFAYSYFYGKYYGAKPASGPAEMQDEPAGRHKVEEILKEEFPDLLEEEVVSLESDLIQVNFTSLRGAVKSLVLKETGLIRDNPVKLVEYQNPDVQPGSLSRIGDLSHKSLLKYKIVDRGEKHIVFEARQKRLWVRKKFTLADNYHLELEIEFKNPGKKKWQAFRGYDLSIGSLKAQHSEEELRPEEVDYYTSGVPGAYIRKVVGKIRERTVEDREVSWGALRTKYFGLIAKTLDKPAQGIVTESVEENFELYYSAALRMGSFELNGGASAKAQFFLYFGPKDYDLLRSFGHHMESLLDFDGIWGSMCHALAVSLRWLHSLCRNYGVAIIILTLLLKLLFYPLSAISLRSMKEMQALKPYMDDIRKKFKDNPKKMQQATMELYKEHNIKPLAGCLPMLVQIPIFIAFYRILMVSIDLRGADFLWISDLARADTIFRIGGFPVNILPVLNGLTMFWQQKLTPTDPSQKMLKYLMPGMITVFFYGLPSGLILYWLVTTLVTVLQQYHVQKTPLKIQAPKR